MNDAQFKQLYDGLLKEVKEHISSRLETQRTNITIDILKTIIHDELNQILDGYLETRVAKIIGEFVSKIIKT